MTGLRIFILACIYFAFSIHLIFGFGIAKPSGTPPGTPPAKPPGKFKGAVKAGIGVKSLNGSCPFKINATEAFAKLMVCTLTNLTKAGTDMEAECDPKKMWRTADVDGCVIIHALNEMENAMTCIPGNLSRMFEGFGDKFNKTMYKLFDKNKTEESKPNSTKECVEPMWKRLAFDALPKCLMAYVVSFFKNAGGTNATNVIDVTSTTRKPGLWRLERSGCLKLLDEENMFQKENRKCGNFSEKVKKMVAKYAPIREGHKELKELCANNKKGWCEWLYCPD